MNLKYYLRGLGIGVIVTAVIMLILSKQNTNTLTDEEIKQKAKALGMIEQNGTLSEMALADNSEGTNSTEDEASAAVVTENVAENGDILKKNPEDDNEPDMSSSGNLDYNEVEKQIDEADAQLEEIKGGSVDSPKPTAEPTPKPTAEPTPKPTAEPTPEPTQKPSSDSSAEQVSKSENDSEVIAFTVNKGEGSYTVAKNLQSAGLIENASEFDTYLCSTGMDRKICAGSFKIPQGSSEDEIAKIISRQ